MLHVRTCVFFALASAGILSAPPLHATPRPGVIGVAANGIVVDDAWAPAPASDATIGTAYVTVMAGGRADGLLSVSTPIAATTEVDETFEDRGVMRVRGVAAIPIPADGVVTFNRDGYNIVLLDMTRPLVAGQRFPLTLTFIHAASVTVEATVRPPHRNPLVSGEYHRET